MSESPEKVPIPTVVERIQAVYDLSFESAPRNDYFTQQRSSFFAALKEKYPYVACKDIPALEKLRGGSEEPTTEIDPELRYEIEDLVTEFLEEMEAALPRI